MSVAAHLTETSHINKRNLRGVDLRAAVPGAWRITRVTRRKRVLRDGGIESQVLGLDGNESALIWSSQDIPTG